MADFNPVSSIFYTSTAMFAYHETLILNESATQTTF